MAKPPKVLVLENSSGIAKESELVDQGEWSPLHFVLRGRLENTHGDMVDYGIELIGFYSCLVRCISSRDLGGLPHLRSRVWIIAVHADITKQDTYVMHRIDQALSRLHNATPPSHLNSFVPEISACST